MKTSERSIVPTVAEEIALSTPAIPETPTVPDRVAIDQVGCSLAGALEE